jgi:hypothetical protein
MYALGVRNLPEGPGWLYEIKLDGYRSLAGKDANGVSLWSRKGNVLHLSSPQSPKHVKVCRAVLSLTVRLSLPTPSDEPRSIRSSIPLQGILDPF